MYREILNESTRDLTVQYAEDDPDIRKIFTRYLSKFFKAVTAAENGREALDIYPDASFDIVMTDIDMPVMNGLELIRAIRERDQDQVVAVCSASYHDTRIMLQLINSRVDGFIKKPVEFEEFGDVLSRLCRKISRRKSPVI